jgi:hypothetical protein
VIKTKVVINESPTPRELILKYVIFKKWDFKKPCCVTFSLHKKHLLFN